MILLAFLPISSLAASSNPSLENLQGNCKIELAILLNSHLSDDPSVAPNSDHSPNQVIALQCVTSQPGNHPILGAIPTRHTAKIIEIKQNLWNNEGTINQTSES